MSYLDSLDFGLNVCPEVIPDVWSIADGLHLTLEELTKAAAARLADEAERAVETAIEAEHQAEEAIELAAEVELQAEAIAAEAIEAAADAERRAEEAIEAAEAAQAHVDHPTGDRSTDE